MIRRLDAAFFAPAPAERLAAVRIAAGLFAAGTTAGIFPSVWKSAHLGVASFRPVLPLAFFPAPPLPALVCAAAAIAFACGIAVAIGAFYRLAAPLLALSFLFVAGYRSSWGMIFHTENLLALHLVALAIAPAADALSWDARRRGSPHPAPSAAYGWPLRLVCALTVVAYFLAGVAKVRWAGGAWATGEFLRNQVIYDNLRKVELGDLHSPLGAALAGHPRLFAPLALGSLALELGAPAALLHRRLGRLWAIGLIGFHLGIVLLMAIAFPYPMTGAAFVAFFDGERAAAWLQARRRARGHGRHPPP